MSNKGAAAICLQHPCLTILCHIRHMTNPIINYICNYPAIGIIIIRKQCSHHIRKGEYI